MHVFDLHKEQEWNPKRHVEKILGEVAEVVELLHHLRITDALDPRIGR